MLINFLYKNKHIVIISLIVIILLLYIYFSTTKNEIIKIDENSDSIESVEKPLDLIKIYVTGEIKESKIIEVEKGIILNDIINMCGGLTKNASLNINLVYPINNNVTLVIKEKKDIKGVDIISDIGNVTVIKDENGLMKGTVDINRATYDGLLMLPGIGKSTAKAIITYRNEHGLFKKIEDIMNVPGIKEAKYNLIKELITIY